jgi:trimethylamine---corrinoid protein Co-methyltransferase
MIHSGQVVQQTAQFRILSDQQIEALHSAALEILRRTGVDVYDPEALELLRRAGAKVDGIRARIPAGLVEWAVRTAPSQVVICDRNGAPAMWLEGRKSYYGTGSDTHNIYDPYSGERRLTVKADVANVARIVDALPNLDFLMCMGIAHDVPQEISDLHHFEAMVTNTTKPLVVTAWNLANLQDIVEMAEIVAGGPEALRLNPFFLLYAEPISPLRLVAEPTQKLLYLAGKGLPCIWTPGQVGGATSPVTLAGALAQGNAEALIGVVLAQLKREGTPIAYGSSTIQMHMGTMVACYEAPEFMLSVMAFADLAHYYRLPVWAYGACTDSKVFDQQAAIGGAFWTLIGALTGGSLCHDVGYLESGLTTSLELLVTANEMIDQARRLVGGIEITPETLALDVIDQVGPAGHFLGTQHTYRHFRENWVPKLYDWNNYQAWESKGKLTLGQRANARVRDILETHTPAPLPEETCAKIGAVIDRAAVRSGVQ